MDIMFQSPRSGQICSNVDWSEWGFQTEDYKFQSPRSGQICSNLLGEATKARLETVSIP